MRENRGCRIIKRLIVEWIRNVRHYSVKLAAFRTGEIIFQSLRLRKLLHYFQTKKDEYVSPYRENIINNSLRYIDWKRGNPYVFTLYDYEELINTKCLFARKFDEKISIEIVHELHANILNA